MVAVSQLIFSDAFLWIKSFVFWLKFHWSLFLRIQLIITQYWFDNGLVSNRRQAIIWINADPIHWRIYSAVLGGDELSDNFRKCTNLLQAYATPIAIEQTLNTSRTYLWVCLIFDCTHKIKPQWFLNENNRIFLAEKKCIWIYVQPFDWKWIMWRMKRWISPRFSRNISRILSKYIVAHWTWYSPHTPVSFERCPM